MRALLCALVLVLGVVHTAPSHLIHSYVAAEHKTAQCLVVERKVSTGYVHCHIAKEEKCIPHAAIRSGEKKLHIVERPLRIVEEAVVGTQDRVIEIFASTSDVAMDHLQRICGKVTTATARSSPNDQVFVFSETGDPANRIDVVFMGDGYTADQKGLYLSDMKRMVTNMFVTQTFNTWLPLYNLWGVFRPSVESGIGYYSTPKNTSYKLYRDGTELRGVYPGDTAAIQDSCTATGPNACDYPTCIGNDPFYGGLGGQFSISTSSVRSGIVVLRHEFGHSMGNVGEEYDSGMHFGANSARTLSSAKNKWGAWFSGALQAEDSNDLVQDYSWFILGNTTNPDYVVTFQSNGTYDRWYLLFSMSGCEQDGVVTVTLDGVALDWHSCDSLDRCFYGFYSATPLSAGTHTLVWHQNVPPTSMFPRQLCSISMLEYKNAPQFHFSNSYVSAYKTYGEDTGFRAYRPMNERCIMRNMSSSEFCVADKENLWLQLVSRVSLIDNVTVSQQPDSSVQTTVNLIPFGQFRSVPIAGEVYSSQWYRNGVLVTELSNTFTWTKSKADSTGSWEVQVQLATLDVRSDPDNAMSAKMSFTI